MSRLYVDAALHEGASVALDASQAHYLGDVLRFKTGDSVLAFNGRDGEWRGTNAEGRVLTATLDEHQERGSLASGGNGCYNGALTVSGRENVAPSSAELV